MHISAAESGCVFGGLDGGEPAGDAQRRRAVGEGVLACQERGVPVQLLEPLLADRRAAGVGEDLDRSAPLDAAGSDACGVAPTCPA